MLYIGLMGAVLFYIVIRFFVLKNPQEGAFEITPLLYRLFSVGRIIVFYIRLLFLPMNLSAEYILSFSTSLFEAHVFFSYLLVLTVVTISIICLTRKFIFKQLDRVHTYGLYFAIWWFLLTLLPVLNIIPLRNPIAERYLYFPTVGFCLLITITGDIIYSFIKNRLRYMLIFLLSVLLLWYSWLTIHRNRDWKNTLTLYKKTAESCQNSARFINNLAMVYAQRGMSKEAEELFKRAIKIEPDYSETYNNYGLLKAGMGKNDEAVALYKKSVELNPNFSEAYNNLGLLYSTRGLYKEAIEVYTKAIDINSHGARAYYNLGNVYQGLKRYDEAIKLYKQAIYINPDDAIAYYNMGNVFNTIRDYDNAIHMFKKAVEIDPNYFRAYNNLGNSYRAKNDLKMAEKIYLKALQVNPKDIYVYNNLGSVYIDLSRVDDAIKLCKKAQQVNPLFPLTYLNLAIAYYQKGEYQLAIQYCDKVRELGGTVDPELIRRLEPYRKHSD